MVTILISTIFIGAALIRERRLFLWIPEGAALIRGRCLFEDRRLLDEIRYSTPLRVVEFVGY